MRVAVLLASLFLLAAPAQSAQTVSADDMARFLAGIEPAPSSPLAALAAEPSWKLHAARLNSTFEGIDKRQLSKVRAWSKANLTVRRPVLFYMFSGPDFLYANSFFPDADTYVLAGLEPVGDVPDVTRLPRTAIPGALGALQTSMRSLLSISFFRTNDMRRQLRATPLQGTLPVLYVFLVRSGKTIRDVSLVHLSETGEVKTGEAPAGSAGARGAKMVFAGSDGREQTLYYFSTNLSDDGFGNGFAQFCERFGEGNAFLKSASYLLHSGAFSKVRGFLLQHSALILQDDTGTPIGMFDHTWQLRPHGHYFGPIKLFAGRNQPKLRELFRRGNPGAIDFGVGYRWHPHESNLLVAVKQEESVQAAAALSASAAPSAAPAPASEPPAGIVAALPASAAPAKALTSEPLAGATTAPKPAPSPARAKAREPAAPRSPMQYARNKRAKVAAARVKRPLAANFRPRVRETPNEGLSGGIMKFWKFLLSGAS